MKVCVNRPFMPYLSERSCDSTSDVIATVAEETQDLVEKGFALDDEETAYGNPTVLKFERSRAGHEEFATIVAYFS